MFKTGMPKINQDTGRLYEAGLNGKIERVTSARTNNRKYNGTSANKKAQMRFDR